MNPIAKTVARSRQALTRWLSGRAGSGVNPLDRWSILRPIASGLVVTLISLALSPLAQAVQQNNALAQRNTPAPEESYNRLLEPYATGKRTTPVTEAEQQELAQAGEAIRSGLQNQLDRFRAAGVSPVIVSAQETLIADFTRHHQAILAVAGKDSGNALASLLRQTIDSTRPQPSGQTAAEKWQKLPWHVEQGKARPPRTDAASLDLIVGTPAPASGKSQPSLKAAQDAAYTPADLAETIEVQLTPAIRAKAAELGNNPHRIYQWVHDNIHWFPSYGSAQGAQDTLDKRSGNAFDTASLLIALLRAASIPARYVYGTIDVPATNMKNWVGGVQTVEAAQQLLAQGGIPNTAMISGGRIDSIRIEHLWVEAWIDYTPARGARHTGGVSQGDSWIPMDGSYKQYTFTPGMNLQSAVPFDAEAFLSAARQGATVNEAEGWIQNLNQTNIQSQLTAYQTRLRTAIETANPQATVGDILGIQKADIDPLPYLAGTTPYRIQQTARRISELPDSLRHHFRYRIYADEWNRQMENSQLDYQAPTAALAGKKITLGWIPASDADRQAIEALLPKAHTDGSPIQPDELPSGLPATIKVKAQLRIEGETRAEGPATSIGSELLGAGAFTRYGNPGDWDETSDLLIAGQQGALGLSIQGISKPQLDTLKTRLEATKSKLETAQAAPENQRPGLLQGLTGEHLTGDLLTANIWSYLASLQSHGHLEAAQAQMIDRPGLSYGLFHAVAQPNKIMGIVTTGVSFKGVLMDVGHLRGIRWVKDDDPQSAINSAPQLTANGRSAAHNRWVMYNRLRGEYSSAMEHAIPEAFFIDRTQCRYTDHSTTPPTVKNPTLPDCAQGISTVKAIALAQAQGQKIFTITQANAAQAIPQLQHRTSVIEEVRSAVAAGKEVTIHEKAITESGWSGAGYAVIDPETGAGGHLIEGGARGGFLLFTFAFALLTVVSLTMFGATIFAWWMLAGTLGSAAHFLAAAQLDPDWGAFLDWTGLVLAAFGVAMLTPFVTASLVAAMGAAIAGFVIAVLTVLKGFL